MRLNPFQQMILAHLVVLAGLTMGICNPGRLWADPQFTSVTLSDTNPLQGSTLGVTVIFCDNTAWAQNRVNMLGAIQNSGLSGFSIFNCGTSGQVMVVSNAGVNVPTTAYVSGMAISQPTQNGVSGGCPSNPVTATWTITLDPAFFPGGDTYHFVVCGKEDYIDCNATSGAACGSADFSIPLPPAAVTVTASAAESPVAPLGLVRYMVDYSFGNTTGFNITFPLPANTTFVAASPGGGLSGGSVSWALGDATRLKRGQAWVLVRVDASAPDASNLTAVFSGVSNEVGAQTSSASAVVRKPNLALTKSQSAASVNAGNTVTYGLTWTVDGQSLQWDDAYDASTGTPTGFDGSTYNTVSNGGVNGSWTLGTDTDNGQYVLANGGGQYPLMLRSTPLDLCASYNVQGDLYIDPSNTPGVDAHLVIAGNGLSGTSSNYYMVGISGDPTPHKVWLQKNVLGVPVTNMAGGYSDSFTINPGTWYTVKAQLSQSGSALVIAVTVWPRGTVEPSFPLFTCTDTSPLVCSPSGNFIGWQADVGFDRYDNLMLTAPGPVANPVVADTLPTGISYAGSQPALSGGPPLLSWSLAATVFGQPAPIQWWGPACFDPVVNTARIASDGVPAVDSNTLTLNVIGSCGPTPTPTETGTPTNSPTPTTTFTMTSTPTPTPTTTITMTSTPTPTGTSTASSTATNTFTASATSTVTATSTMTSTPTPRPPTATPTPNRQFHLWPNPYNPADAVRGTLKASYMPTGSTLEIVTVSGEKVARLSPVNNRVEWNGKTGKGRAATPGIYYYILSQGASLLEKGEFVLTNGAQ